MMKNKECFGMIVVILSNLLEDLCQQFLIKQQTMFDKGLVLVLLVSLAFACDPCYSPNQNDNCRPDSEGKGSYTLHMTVHPHLDAFWIFNFDSYYEPKPNQGDVRGYFQSNRFSSVKDIFTTAKEVLWQSKRIRDTQSNRTQAAHRSFVNSQMGFFKHWFYRQVETDKEKVRELLKTKYWEVLGGGFVEHDEGCAYYDDIIQNFELGLHFLKEEFNYYPKVSMSADSFGHSQSTLAILAHLGIEGAFVQRSDEHILLQNKTEFVWRAKSANNEIYGALPTHIRWAIHGFQDQFMGGNVNENMCQNKQNYMNNLRQENEFLKRILKSTHIMRYFGHDFQKFDNYSYTVIESMMKKFSMQKCNRVTAVYGNPTEYFMTLMGQVFGKVKPVATRSEDIMPIWDYDSGLYWSGYYTTDAYHKKDYRDLGRFLHGARKIFLNSYANTPDSDRNKKQYLALQHMAEQVSYLQHHDGISGTSKYVVMDELEMKNKQLTQEIEGTVLRDVFAEQFPIGTNSPLFTCHLDKTCSIPSSNKGDVYLKIINTDANPIRDPVIVEVPIGHHYLPDCEHQLNCFCYQDVCPCRLYLYKLLFTFTTVRLKKLDEKSSNQVYRLNKFVPSEEYKQTSTHFQITVEGKSYSVGYKKVQARATSRFYDHLSRYGQQYGRSFSVRPGKYALGNDPNSVKDFSHINKISQLQSQKMLFFLIEWKRYKMKTLISIKKQLKNEWKVQTIASTEAYYKSDLYFQVGTPIQNKNQFVTDSNGWLTIKRQMFKHEDYNAHFSKQKFDDLDGNSYPVTSFVYIEDETDKVSVNVERPQGATSYRPGTIWINFDRLSQDDGKWVYQSAFRSQYQKYSHTITVHNKNNNQRKIQRQYDQPLFIQGNSISPTERVESTQIDVAKRNEWNAISNIDNIKFMIRPFNDSTTILRVHNLNDSAEITMGLFADKVSPFLTTYYARTVTFSQITQASLGGNMAYSKFISEKWNWNSTVNLSEQNQIFNKQFKENITLRPLQIRTFIMKNLNFDDKCHEVKDVKYNKQGISYTLDIGKPHPKRDPLTVKLQQDIIKYNQEEDHCSVESPVLKRDNVEVGKSQSQQARHQDFTPKPVDVSSFEVRDPVKTPTNSKPVIDHLSESDPKTKINQDSSEAPVPPLNVETNLNYQQLRKLVFDHKVMLPSQKRKYFQFKLIEIQSHKANQKK